MTTLKMDLPLAQEYYGGRPIVSVTVGYKREVDEVPEILGLIGLNYEFTDDPNATNIVQEVRKVTFSDGSHLYAQLHEVID